MRRREFITLLGGAATVPMLRPRVACAQQPAMPAIGFLGSAAPVTFARRVAAFHQGLKEAGYVEGQNVAIEYRWAEDQYDRLPTLAADLVRRQVAVLVTQSDAAAFAAKAATTTIPIVFMTGGDPVRTGIVESMARPSGNVTGVTFFGVDLGPKRLGLLRELVPAVTTVGFIVDQNQPDNLTQVAAVEAAARSLGVQLVILYARNPDDIDAAFVRLVQEKAGALLLSSGALFTSRRSQLIVLAARHAIPAIYQASEFVSDGGLVSYGNSITDVYRRAAIYAGRILKGAKPSDLPVEQSSKFELAINLKTAKAIGLTISRDMLLLADEVIE